MTGSDQIDEYTVKWGPPVKCYVDPGPCFGCITHRRQACLMKGGPGGTECPCCEQRYEAYIDGYGGWPYD